MKVVFIVLAWIMIVLGFVNLFVGTLEQSFLLLFSALVTILNGYAWHLVAGMWEENKRLREQIFRLLSKEKV